MRTRNSLDRSSLPLALLTLPAITAALALGCSSSSDTPASSDAGANSGTGGGSPSGGAGGGVTTGSGGTGNGQSGGSGTGASGGTGAGGGGASGSGGANAGGSGGTQADGGGLPGDTFLPWAGGPAYFAKWTKGPPNDPTFFPIAVWLQSPPNADRYKTAGINLFIGLYQGPTDAQLSTLKTAGIPTFCDQGGVWNAHLTDSTIWGWLQPDEPDNAQANSSGGYDPCIAPATIISGYNTMVGNDATRPVWLGLGRGVSDTNWGGRGTCTGNTAMYTDYAKGADILSFDIYPVNGSIGLEAVPKGVDNLRQWSGYTKPVVADIEGSQIDTPNPRPTAAQIKSEVWMALVHGAAGIQYFCHRFSPTFSETDCIDDSTRATALGAINAQVTALATVLNTQSVGNGVTVTSSVPATPIDTMLKRQGGATYLFAAEMRSGTAKGTFTLRDFPATASAEVIGETRTIPVANGVFADDFDTYGVHLYKITY